MVLKCLSTARSAAVRRFGGYDARKVEGGAVRAYLFPVPRSRASIDSDERRQSTELKHGFE